MPSHISEGRLKPDKRPQRPSRVGALKHKKVDGRILIVRDQLDAG
jgi:hypothetical protein